MTEARIRFEGLAVTADYLTVYLTVGDRLAKRVREVKVPIHALLDAEVVPEINRAATQRLKALWDLEQATLPPWD